MRRINIQIQSSSPILMHSAHGVMNTLCPYNRKLERLRNKENKSNTDCEMIARLECRASIWKDDDGLPTIPVTALRSTIEAAARKERKGAKVREGLVVERVLNFDYDKFKYGESLDQLEITAQFTVPVVVDRKRVLRTRAKFDDWDCDFVVSIDKMISEDELMKWVSVAGKHVGLGDWRPQKSGIYGRFGLWENGN